MKKLFKKTGWAALALAFAFNPAVPVKADFADVPPDHWAYPYVNELQSMGISNGIGENRFGLGQTIIRAEFITFLCNLMKWQLVDVPEGHFADVPKEKWYFPFVETALQKGAITVFGGGFRPEEPVTREEMAVMIVRALGYDALANQITYLPAPFSDVTDNKGYISIAKDLGILSGVGEGKFNPGQTATREQAATMIVCMHRLLGNKIDFLNGFYAIRSAGQMDAIPSMDAVSFGWSRLETDGTTVSLNTTSAGSNDYSVPSGFEAPYNTALGKARILMVAVTMGDASTIIGDESLGSAAVDVIGNAINNGLSGSFGSIDFDGVVVDFEGLKGEGSKNNFNAFLAALREKIGNKQMYVAVHPQRRDGHAYYDGYDYREIGRLSDKVILMAHDYNAKALTPEEMERGIVMTPLAPLEEVYYALAAITNKDTGVEDRGKIALQINFSAAQWKLKDGKVLHSAPYTPDYNAVASRIRAGAEMKYSLKYESPYITFLNADDGSHNVVWYEDERSVEAKLKLAELFGVEAASFWRLGAIPQYGSDIYLNVLSKIMDR